MSIIYPPVIDQIFFDNEGNVLANGFVRAFYHGTTSLAPTYNRNNETNTSPIELDASGRAQFKLSTDVAYDIQTYDMNDALIETMPNIRLQNGGGSSSAPFDLLGMGLEISGNSPDRTLKITSEYDAGLVHTTGDEEIGGAKVFAQAVQAAGVISALDFSLLQPNTGSSVQSVVNSNDGNARVGFGVFADENGKTQINVNFTQRGVANNIVMNDSGKIGTPLNGDKTEIDPFVLQSEIAEVEIDLTTLINGKAPTSHESTATTYGVGSATNYGHVKLYSSTGAATDGAIDANTVTNELSGKAPTSHASSTTTYGVGTEGQHGHVKLYTSTGNSTDGAMDRNSVTTVLNEKEKAILYSVITTTTTIDFNDIHTNTIAKIGGVAQPTGYWSNWPSSTYRFGTFSCFAKDEKDGANSAAYQMWVPNSEAFPIAFRNKYAGGAWTPWMYLHKTTQTNETIGVTTGSTGWNLDAYNSLQLTTALTGNVTINLSNPIAAVKNTLMFQQGSTARTVTLSLSGVSFRQAGNTSANSNTISLAGITTVNAFRVVTLNWVSATVCYISVD